MVELNSEIIVQDLTEKMRLDIFLSLETGWTRSQVKLQIDSGKVFVNEKVQKSGFLIKNISKISFKQLYYVSVRHSCYVVHQKLIATL